MPAHTWLAASSTSEPSTERRLPSSTLLPSGAILAPHYQAGVTSQADWLAIQARPAPWGEIGSSNLAIATPAASLSKVSDPAAVMAYWDKVRRLLTLGTWLQQSAAAASSPCLLGPMAGLLCCPGRQGPPGRRCPAQVMEGNAWLAAYTGPRAKPERIQHDVQIGGGYMHAGYPVRASWPRLALTQSKSDLCRRRSCTCSQQGCCSCCAAPCVHMQRCCDASCARCLCVQIMTWMDVRDSTLEPPSLWGKWGLMHELGHNHQARATISCTRMHHVAHCTE